MAAIANRIVVGELNSPIATFVNDDIISISEERSVSLIGDELAIDQFVPIVNYEVLVSYAFRPIKTESTTPVYYDGMKVQSNNAIFCTAGSYDIRKLPYGTRVTFYSDDQNVGEFFVKNVERIGRTRYRINAMSAIGLMDNQYHTGNLYVGAFFEDVLAEILGGEYEYYIDSNYQIAKMRVTGWLPYATRRRNLHQLILAFGVNITKNANGKMFFTFLESVEPQAIPDANVFDGGSVIYDEPASRIDVTEHTYQYFPKTEEETLFDNTRDNDADHTLVTFDHPVYADSIRCSEGNLTIHSRGVNYAEVSGLGILVGKPYIHTTKVVSADNPENVSEKIVKVEEATLITLLNSENVLSRLSQYYFNATTVKQDIYNTGEKAGGLYSTTNSFGEPVTGFISRMSTNATSFRRSSCEIIQGYRPTGQGLNYTQQDIIPLNTNASSTWSVSGHGSPSKVRVVLIGFGEDGETGSAGQAGKGGDDREKGVGGEGGKGGKGGRGGKILSFTLDTTGLTSLNFSNSGKNSLMTTTPNPTSTTYSSANGASLAIGYYDPAMTTTYALPGQDGMDGGKGGDGELWKHTNGWEAEVKATSGESVTYNGVTYNGGAISTGSERQDPGLHRDQFIGWYYPGGTHFQDKEASVDPGIANNYQFFSVWVSASGGGGAAVGHAGGAGRLDINNYYSNGTYAGTGGNGANANNPPATSTVYGSGGNGGHGGGGGGGGSSREWMNIIRQDQTELPYDNYDSSPTQGQGGTGSAGTAGYRGCAIVYY